ncbi:hypothetical protein AAMO2058_001280300 [Amorphochlora amoebiformis]
MATCQILQCGLRAWHATEDLKIIRNTRALTELQAHILTVLALKRRKKRLKAKKKRENAIKEMVTCEAKYVTNLLILRDRFQIPTEALAKRKRWPKNDVQKIFNYLEPIIKLHQDTICVELNAYYARGKNIALVFIKYARWFAIYAQYLKNYNVACDTLYKYREKYKSFHKLLDAQRVDRDTGKRFQEIVSYLIMPCQRISRYELLLQEILRNSFQDEDAKIYDELVEAHKIVHKVAMSNEIFQKNSEDISRLLSLQHTIKGMPITLFAPTRRLIKEGKVQIGKCATKRYSLVETLHKVSEGVEMKPSLLYLFTDIVMWTDCENSYQGHGSLSKGVVHVHERKEGKYINFKLYKYSGIGSAYGKKVSMDTLLCVKLPGKPRKVCEWGDSLKKAIADFGATEKSWKERKARNMR